jgi:hypothetical protein
MPVQYGGDRITFSDGSTVGSGWSGFKNRIINGDMQIDQRNAGASVNNISGNLYTLDRWAAYANQATKFSIQQSSTSTSGFRNSLLITSLSAYTVGSGEEFSINQAIEGFNIADLGWGTASAQTVTLSFWVRSSLTGTFGGALRQGSGTRSYPFSYTINSANTFEYKTITIAGDTSGTWNSTNGAGILLGFGLGCGSSVSGTAGAWVGSNIVSTTGATSVVGTNGATFYITGVQLEKGSTATSFDYLPYTTELALCQRYFYTNVNAEPANGVLVYNNIFDVFVRFPVTMRSAPTFDSTNPTNGVLCQTFNANFYASSFGTPNILTENGASLLLNVSQTGYAGQSGKVYFGWSGSQRIRFSAEL